MPTSAAFRARHVIVKPADLTAHKLIAHSERRETWSFCRAAGAAHDVEIAPGTVVPEPDVVKTLLIAGAGIGMLPDFHAAPAIAIGLLVRVLPQYESGSVDVHALYPSHRSLSAKVRVFMDSLVAHLASER